MAQMRRDYRSASAIASRRRILRGLSTPACTGHTGWIMTSGTPDPRSPAPRPAPAFTPRLALLLFGLSCAMLAASALLYVSSGASTPIYRRGPTPLTREWTPNELWVHDDEVEHLMNCELDTSMVNEDGQSVPIKAVPVGPSGECFRDDGVTHPVLAVVLGDSFAFGHAVNLPDSFVERLEASLGGDVVSLGVSNTFACTQYLRVLRRCGIPLRPRLVIWATFVNDWLDETMFMAWLDLRPRLGYQSDYPNSRSIYVAVRRHGYFLPPQGGQPARNPPIDSVENYEGGGLRFQFDPSSYAAQDLRMKAIDQGRIDCESALAQAAALARDSGAELLVVAIPTKESVYHRQAGTVLPYARTSPRDTFCANVEAFCRAEGIPCVNLLPPLVELADRGEQVYFPVDGHFNARGHQIAAQAIHDYIVQNGLVEPRASAPRRDD